MLLIEESFPLLVLVAPKRYDAAEVQAMAAAFEAYYDRGERYALVSTQPKDSIAPGPHERKLLTDWVNSARVRQEAGRLCIGSAAVVSSAVMRGALTAITWFWTPPFPLHVAATAEEGIDHCLGRLTAANVRLPTSAASMKQTSLQRLDEAMRGPTGARETRRPAGASR